MFNSKVTVAVALLGLLLGILAFHPAWRRVMLFHLHAAKYACIWLLDKLKLRRLWAGIRRKPYEKMTTPVLIRRFCEDMGPTFIKFGQIIASSEGMFPASYVQAFRRCLDRVPPFPFADVERIIAEDLPSGHRLARIESVPLASASVAQVHAAVLHDGSHVVIKVQRPGIAAMMAADIRVMRVIARIVQRLVRDVELANPVGIIDDFAQTVAEELDFGREAENMREFNRIMGAKRRMPRVRAPKPLWASRRVLVMERFYGFSADRAEDIIASGADAEEALVAGVRSWLQCVLLHGFFHGDVHAGNLMLLEDGDVGFLDFGIVGRFDAEQRRLVTDYMLAFTRGDYRTLAQVTWQMGSVPATIDMKPFAADLATVLAPIRTKPFGDVNYAELVPGINAVATKHRMRLPREFVLILKQYIYFDRYAKRLAPRLNIFTDPRLLLGMMDDIRAASAPPPDQSARQNHLRAV